MGSAGAAVAVFEDSVYVVVSCWCSEGELEGSGRRGSFSVVLCVTWSSWVGSASGLADDSGLV